MEAREYRTLFDLEDSYWWFVAVRRALVDALESAGVGPSGRVLDAGCGTGGSLERLQRSVTASAFGFDVSPDARTHWPLRGIKHVCTGSIHEVPFRAGTFDAVLCVDVLESDGVAEEQAYGELWRVTRCGGLIIILVPGHGWLRDGRHHRAVHATRRYTRTTLASLLRRRPVEIVRMTHLFPTFLPAVAAVRLAGRLPWTAAGEPRSDLRRLPRLVNEALVRVAALERRLLRAVDAPFGSSILAVARKLGGV